MSNFNTLTKLAVIDIHFETTITSTTVLPLAGLPTHKVTLAPVGDDIAIDETVFVPFTSAREIHTYFRALSALRYLSSQLQYLWLATLSSSFPLILHNTTFRVLSKFNESLTTFVLNLPVYEIENDSFMWLPNLVRLGLLCQVETIAKQSFRRLTALQEITLPNNRLTTLPSDALKNIGKSTSLQCLDLSSNSISTIADDAFVAVSSLTYLNLENNKIQYKLRISTKWINVLQFGYWFCIYRFRSNTYWIINSYPFASSIGN